jgi:hypothetical protein
MDFAVWGRKLLCYKYVLKYEKQKVLDYDSYDAWFFHASLKIILSVLVLTNNIVD